MAYVIIGVVMWLMVGYEQLTGEKIPDKRTVNGNNDLKRIPPLIEEKTIEMQIVAKASGIAGASMILECGFLRPRIPRTAFAENVIKKSAAVKRQTRS